MKLDMTDFEYKNGNTIEFDGAFGKVKLTYLKAVKEYDPYEGKEKEIPSHFVAELFCNGEGKLPNIGSGVTENNAIDAVYVEYARFRALEDCGRL